MDCTDFKTEVESLLHSISSKFNYILKEFYEPYGLTAVQAVILIALYHRGPGKISDIAKDLTMTNSNLSVICRRLEKGGYILRKRDEEDQRVVYLHLTDASIEILDKLDQRITTDYLCPLEAASDEDMALILRGMKILDQLLSGHKDEHPTTIHHTFTRGI